MRFAFTADQQLFAEGLRDLLAKECTPAQVRATWDDGTGHDAALWAHLGGMGVLGVLVPEDEGGFGGTEVDLVLLLEELGKAAAPGPVIEHAAVVAPALVGTEFASGLADGSLIGTAFLQSSPARYVPTSVGATTAACSMTGPGAAALPSSSSNSTRSTSDPPNPP